MPVDTLTFSLDAASIALGMSIDANTGVFSWTPTEAQDGLTPSVTVTVTDNGTGALTDSETFTITVNRTNVDPIAGDDAYSIVQDTSLSTTSGVDDLLQNDFDPDSSVLIVDAVPVSGPSNGILVLNADGTFVYTPNAGICRIRLFRLSPYGRTRRLDRGDRYD